MPLPPDLRTARLQARAALERAGKLPFKPVSSAKWVDVYRTWTGKLHVCIEHDTLRGCTASMMRWWFENLARTTTWDGIGFDGPDVSFYHLWHHRDHVRVEPPTGPGAGASFAVGTRSRIVEQFNDYQEKIDVDVYSECLDDGEFTFTVKRFGLSVCRVVHFYKDVADGCRFYAETVVGNDIPIIGWFINWVIVPFIYSEKTAGHWIKHNIEETGRSEDIVPVLYARYRS